MNLEDVNLKLVALLGNATSIRGELSPCPEYFKDISESTTWQDQMSRNVGELQGQIVAGITVLDTLVKEMQREVEREPTKLAHSESWMAIQMATKDFGICPNRLWAIARGHQDGSLTKLIRPLRDNEPMLGHADHEQCNYELCEHSRRDFTWVAQRHESEDCRRDISEACEPLRYRFSIETLDEAARARRPTAWRLDGQSMVEPGQGYLAVSHVWSDGTGTGAWLEREVNGCLYDYFASVARRFHCEGIWWDTICIPKDKAARSIAVNRMHRNYQDARVTFVHDCYLHDLLSVLQSRNTSWPRDMATIAGLLTGVENTSDATQQRIFQDILRKIGTISADHLFHNSPVMSDPAFGWCPANFLDMELSSTGATLRINERGQCSRKQTPLHRAAWGGSFAVTEMLLEAGADPDALDWRGQSPLHLAAQHGYVEVASLLMKRSDASILNSEGFTALHLALLEGHNDMVKCLVRENDDLHSTDGRGYTVLHLAAHTGNVDLVKWLVSKGSNTALRNSNGLRPVHLAAESGNDATLRWLLRHEHVDSDPVVDEAWEMLHSASKGGIGWIVSDILHGDESRINIRDPQGRSALHVAAGAGKTEMVRLLLDAKVGADVDAVDNGDQTPLFYAGNNGHVSVAKELIRRGANVTAVDANGETPFLHAAINNHVPVLKLLLKNGAALGLKDQKRISSAQRDADYGLHPNTTVAVWVSNEVRIKADLLQRVVMNGHQEVLRVLFENDVDEKTFHLEKILVRENLKIKDLLLKDAVEHGQDSIIRLLLEQGADMDVYKSGYPWNRDRPLMAWASMKGHLSTVKLLLRNKADADPRGGYVPLVSAAYSGHEDIVRLLLKAKANINRICKFSFQTALSAAASNGHTATVKLLLDMGADTDPCRERGHTRPQGDSRHDELCAVPIVAAAKGGYQEIVRLLVKNKAIIDSVMVDTRDTGEYLTALSAAARNGDLEMVQFLVKSGACLAPKPIYGEHVTFPLESAARFGHEAVIDFLLQGRTDVNLPIWGASLTGAARHGHTKVVELLIRKGAHVDQPTTDSPIAAAILKRHDSIIKLLIQNGCSANAMSINVYTALSAAAYVGDVDTTQWLLLAGAKVDQPTNYPPIYEAASQGYDKIVKLLIQGGADVNSRASDQYNCLIRATQRNFYEVVKVLVECDADVNARGFVGETAIATAAKNGNLDIMRLLISTSDWKRRYVGAIS
ncbi:hypothetical protein BHE90_003940 [Fusarium euwallaceae]|uniref:Heterokaryon incompatibility domain-containing protein n=1 Tax=Fusarium euwallaceae TaxID=1147111 RepID=A0A430M0Q6_9HYPO|nr:hypothetical protein BHE90_003940 [Fusarium euwallaceae]